MDIQGFLASLNQAFTSAYGESIRFCTLHGGSSDLKICADGVFMIIAGLVIGFFLELILIAVNTVSPATPLRRFLYLVISFILGFGALFLLISSNNIVMFALLAAILVSLANFIIFEIIEDHWGKFAIRIAAVIVLTIVVAAPAIDIIPEAILTSLRTALFTGYITFVLTKLREGDTKPLTYQGKPPQSANQK